jgi:PAS domain S-box-containing protein
VIGTLFLRASRKRSFSNEEIKFCRVVASAAASAIKNSMLYRALEEHAREQEATGERLRLLFDNSPDLILHLDREGTIREANLAVERLSGRSRTELLGQPATGLFRGLPPMPVLRDRLREAERPVAYEAKLLAQDGEERNLSVTAGAVVNTRDGVILIGRDVTEQNRATMLLQQTEKLSSIGEIVASVAHELNNPLSGVLGFSQLLAQKDSEGRFKRDIERIVECADRCQKIVQNLLSFARPFTPEKKPLGLNGVLDKTLDLLERPLQADNIEVVREYAPDLPFVLADFHQVQQVFTNLITNAHQAMTADKGQGRLVLRTTSRDGRVHVEVRDDGPGIPPDVLPRIFDPFFSTKGQGRGTGLGLSVSYGILRDHGGELRVDTRVGGGTSFTVVLPIHSTAADTAAPRPAMAAGTSGGKRILVVDDEEVIVELYVQLLQALGHSIDTASTGLEALRKIEQNTYDLVISDIKMPKMNGIQLFEKAALAKPGMRNRFIFITGDMNSLTSQQFSTITDHPCLIKPVNIEKIESTIRELLGDRTAGADSPVSVN